MAFLGQLQAKFQEIKTQVPQVGQVLEQANKAKQNLVPVFNKCTQQLDSLGKILQVVRLGKELVIHAIDLGEHRP
jgi:hypothetical protein